MIPSCTTNLDEPADESGESKSTSIKLKLDQKSFSCEKCPKIFKSTRGLRKHKQTHIKILNLKGDASIVPKDADQEEQVVYYNEDDKIVLEGVEGTDYLVIELDGN